jgi:pyruvate kinase
VNKASIKAVGHEIAKSLKYMCCTSAVIATLGPAIRRPGILCDMLKAGLTALRYDLTWGTLKSHLKALDMAQRVASDMKKLCAMCLDVRGKTCQVVQPFTEDEDGCPVFAQNIVIACGQTIILTPSSGIQMYVPEVCSPL